MIASELLHHCGIDSWTSNNRIVHATSRGGVTFSRRAVVVPAFAHEPNVIRAPSGEWVMYYTSFDAMISHVLWLRPCWTDIGCCHPTMSSQML